MAVLFLVQALHLEHSRSTSPKLACSAGVNAVPLLIRRTRTDSYLVDLVGIYRLVTVEPSEVGRPHLHGKFTLFLGVYRVIRFRMRGRASRGGVKYVFRCSPVCPAVAGDFAVPEKQRDEQVGARYTKLRRHFLDLFYCSALWSDSACCVNPCWRVCKHYDMRYRRTLSCDILGRRQYRPQFGLPHRRSRR
uniref:Uncharacterized protein n=1 Tax=Ixodes ricinus TaxID=34613 RepID=A0A6B0V1C9_IXORI